VLYAREHSLSEAFEIPGILASIAEGSITLAGLAALFRAFRGGQDPDGFNWMRLNFVIEGGLVIAFVCYLPVALANAGLSTDTSWRLASGCILIWVFPRQNITAAQIFMQGRPYPELFWLAAPLGFLATMFVLANITGLSPISVYSTFLLSVLFLVGFVSTIFVAQFRIERTTSDP
jgi:hypothetical protein